MNKIRVLIVNNSLFFRELLMDYLSQYINIELVGTASITDSARHRLPLLKPDVVILVIDIWSADKFHFLKELLLQYPIPVILISSSNPKQFYTLPTSHVDYIQTPNLKEEYSIKIFISSLYSKLIAAKGAQTRVSSNALSHPPQGLKPPSSKSRSMVIAIGASTGGTEAILAILKQLPPTLPPIIITQHMPSGFTGMYAQRLNRLTELEVREAKNGDVLKNGLALIAPGGMQMKLIKGPQGYSVLCYLGEPYNGLAPSVDILFHSAAKQAGPNSIGIILTGMGSDGAEGLLHMRRNGAYTIGQDKESSIVYGMPMEAYRNGAVCQQAALETIPAVLMNYLAKQA